MSVLALLPVLAAGCLQREEPILLDDGFAIVVCGAGGEGAGDKDQRFLFRDGDDVGLVGVMSDQTMSGDGTKATLFNGSFNQQRIGVYGYFFNSWSSHAEPNIFNNVAFNRSGTGRYTSPTSVSVGMPRNSYVRLYAYWPMASENKGVINSGVSDGVPYIDYECDCTLNPDLSYDLLYGSSVDIHGRNLSTESIPFSHGLSALDIRFGSAPGFGQIYAVSISGLYTRGRLSLDGTWSQLGYKVVGGSQVSSYSRNDFEVDFVSNNSLFDDGEFDGDPHIVVIPQTLPAGATINVTYHDGYSLRHLSADASGFVFRPGHKHVLTLSMPAGGGYVHMDYPEDCLQVPWQGGVYGNTVSSLDEFCVWCECGNNTSFSVDVISNNGIRLNASCDDIGYPSDYDDEYDWYRCDGEYDCSRLYLNVYPNLNSSSPLEAVIRIYCEDDSEHRPYDLRIVQAGNPTPGYSVTAKNVVYNFNGNYSFSSDSYSTFFTTDIPSSLYNGLGRDGQVEFTFNQSAYPRLLNCTHAWDSDENEMMFNVYALCPNFTGSDIVIPYKVSVCGIESGWATITLKCGNITSPYYVLTVSPSTLVVSGTSGTATGTFYYTWGGTARTYTPTLSSYYSSYFNYASLVSGNTAIASVSGRSVSGRAVGNATLTSVFQGYSASAVVTVQNTTLSVSPASLTFDSVSSAAQSVNVYSNTRWSLINKPNWVTMATLSYITGDRLNISVNVSSNTGAPRTGTVTFRTVSGSPTRTVTLTVYQRGRGNVDFDPWTDGGQETVTW